MSLEVNLQTVTSRTDVFGTVLPFVAHSTEHYQIDAIFGSGLIAFQFL